MDNDENKSPGEEIFTIRNLSFGVMAVAIASVFYVRSMVDSPNTAGAVDLEKRQFQFMVKVLAYQAVFSTAGSEKNRKQSIDSARTQIRAMQEAGRGFLGPALVQKYIILAHMGVKPKELKTEFKPADLKDPIVGQFNNLYLREKPLPESATLFQSPAGRLALLRQLELKKKKEQARKLQSELMAQATIWITLAGFMAMSLVGIMLGNVIALWIFHTRKPVPVYHLTLARVPEAARRLLLETPILFLFLMFPVSYLLREFMVELPRDLAAFAATPAFQLFFILGIFALALLYFQRSGRTENESTGEGGNFRELILERDASFMREIFFGLTGFVVIFPIALATMFITIQFLGTPGESGQFAHPIAHQIADHPLTVFVLAVIVAPIVEEVIFRSFLYGYLRTHLSIGFSAIITGALFAILHPQGYIALPYLFVLGTGLCILREMRPGVVAPIVTHMCVNGLAIGGAFLIFNM